MTPREIILKVGSQIINNRNTARKILQESAVSIEVESASVEDVQELSKLAYDLGCYDLASNWLVQALKKNPNQPILLNNLGNALVPQLRFVEAEACLMRACELDVNNASCLYNLALLYSQMGDLDKSLSHFKKLILQCEEAFVYAGLAAVLEMKGDWAGAEENARHALNQDSSFAEAKIILATLYRQQKKYDEALDLLNEVLLVSKNTNALYEKGNILDRQSRYADAYESYLQANESIAPDPDLIQSKKSQLKVQLDYLKDLSVTPVSQLHSETKANKGPVFIIGSPRSGTTLLSQMLGRHPDIFNAGELTVIPSLVGEVCRVLKRELSVLDVTKILWKNESKEMRLQLRQNYFDKMQKIHPSINATYILDKQPMNAHHLGILTAILPEAPVIHMVRHGYDVALSAFMQNFRTRLWHSYSLNDALDEWCLTLGIVEHATKAFGTHLFQLRYEDLLESPETKLKAVFEFLNLKYDSVSLDLYESKSFMGTASYQQVRHPLYKTSVGRYQNYRKFFDESKNENSENASLALKKCGYAPG